MEKTVYLKPCGCATQENSLAIPDFLSAMFRQGCARVAIDLRECKGMDSTFLGIIAYASTLLSGQTALGTGSKAVLVLNPCREHLRDLQTVGLRGLVALRGEPFELPEGLKLERIGPVHFPGSERERIEKIKDMHRRLVDLNERNRRQFSSFVAMVDGELAEKEQEN